MNIELKNIKHAPSLSEETEAFTASLYINGKHAGYAKNAGHGGSTDYYHKDASGKELIKQAEEYMKSFTKPDDRFINMALEEKIDDLLYEHLKKKDLKKLTSIVNKAMLTGIVYGMPDRAVWNIKYDIPIVKILSFSKGPLDIMNAIKDKLLPHLKDGNRLLNTNIPESIIKAAGLKEDQYVKPAIRDIQYGTIPNAEENKTKRGRSI